jgi:hypothetical protein
MAKSSAAFVADLPQDMSAEALEKLYGWGKSTCAQFDVHMNVDGSMALVAVRRKSGTARDHMKLLRTLLLSWGVTLPPRQAGWLRIIDEEAELSRVPADQAPAATAAAPQKSDEESSPVQERTAEARVSGRGAETRKSNCAPRKRGHCDPHVASTPPSSSDGTDAGPDEVVLPLAPRLPDGHEHETIPAPTPRKGAPPPDMTIHKLRLRPPLNVLSGARLVPVC